MFSRQTLAAAKSAKNILREQGEHTRSRRALFGCKEAEASVSQFLVCRPPTGATDEATRPRDERGDPRALNRAQFSLVVIATEGLEHTLATNHPDHVPGLGAAAPCAPTEPPKKMPTTTPMMNFAMDQVLTGESQL
jgi:hypothetical protein